MHEMTGWRLSLSAMDRKRICEEHIEKIVNEENNWDQVINADMMNLSFRNCECYLGDENRKAAGPSEVNFAIIAAGGQVGEEVMRGIFDGKSMPCGWIETKCRGTSLLKKRRCLELQIF